MASPELSVPYTSMTDRELIECKKLLEQEYHAVMHAGFNIDITRGKPAADQLDLAQELLTLPAGEYRSADGIDCRNYGGERGLGELIDIFAPLIPAPAENTIVLGNSSLEIMSSLLYYHFLHEHDGAPWSLEQVSFLCPVPGYDRHFAITEGLGVTMIPVAMEADGPDTQRIQELVARDSSIKGMWLTPVYSNPTGATISEEKMHTLASMKTAAPDFRIWWDNAYGVHSLAGDPPVRDFFAACAQAGNPDRPYIFASTSKITFAGSGVAFFAASDHNLQWFFRHRSRASIGPDKLNQLRHAKYLQSPENVRAIMAEQAKLLKPKFDTTLEILDKRLSGPKVAHWQEPKGGYFISLDVYPHSGRKVVELAARLGIKLLPIGSAYPYGHDALEANLRLAPTFITRDDVAVAIDAITICVLIAAVERIIIERNGKNHPEVRAAGYKV